MRLYTLLAVGLIGSGVWGQTREADWKTLGPNFLSDQKAIWTFPAQPVEGRHWKPALAFLGAAAGMIALDPKDTPYFRKTSTFHSFNSGFSGSHTALGIVLAPVSLYIVSYARNDSYARSTALLGAEALADSGILTLVMKSAGRRLRPSALPPGSKYGDTWFESGSNSGFPSGHTMAAFSLATVVAHRYARHRWVPYLSYGLATLVGFSRITTSAHFPSDVFVGAALGYSVGRFAVLR